jgi:hydroxymethylglutaryl-CoA lyase
MSLKRGVSLQRGLSSSVHRGMTFPHRVKVVEVGPRDGLQNEKVVLPPSTRLQLIQMLRAAGVLHIEAGSFVSPKWVPQMKGSDEVFLALQQDQVSDLSSGTPSYSALTPNVVGLTAALSAGVKEVAVFAAVSETFSQKNINCSIDESFKRFESVVCQALSHGLKVRGYVSCVWGCPYEGLQIRPQQVLSITQRLLDLGCYEVSLGDTIGTGESILQYELSCNVVYSILLIFICSIPLYRCPENF